MAGYYSFMLVLHVFVRLCLSVIHLSVFLFLDNNLSKCQWIFTKLAICNDIVEIWFGIANGQISSVICPPHDSGVVLLFDVFIFCLIAKRHNYM